MADVRAIYPSRPLLLTDNHFKAPGQKVKDEKESFADVLAANTGVEFSKHAAKRLTERNLNLSGEDLQKLDKTVEQMARKGAKESLIYLNDIALVVSVPSRKVITAMDGASARDNIFTNIDSAAII